MCYQFIFDDRLGISLPYLEKDWEDYTVETQVRILAKWETIRGSIPERIMAIEDDINKNQAQLETEESFERSCDLAHLNAELASIINDLWIWYRVRQDISTHP